LLKRLYFLLINILDSSQYLDGCRTATLLAILIWLRITL